MCARYSLFATAEELVEWFRLGRGLRLAPRYNIAPTQPVPAVIQPAGSADRVMTAFRWGLIPSWFKKPLKEWRAASINARSEEIEDTRQ